MRPLVTEDFKLDFMNVVYYVYRPCFMEERPVGSTRCRAAPCKIIRCILQSVGDFNYEVEWENFVEKQCVNQLHRIYVYHASFKQVQKGHFMVQTVPQARTFL